MRVRVLGTWLFLTGLVGCGTTVPLDTTGDSGQPEQDAGLFPSDSGSPALDAGVPDAGGVADPVILVPQLNLWAILT